MNKTKHLYTFEQMMAMDPAIVLNNEGMLLMNAGKHEAAHRKFTESLAIKERLVGRNTAHCALSLMNLGDNYLKWGKLDEAEAVGKEALKIRLAIGCSEARYSRELLDDIKKARAQLKPDVAHLKQCANCSVEGCSKKQDAEKQGKKYMQKCAGCKSVYYCSKQCQNERWKQHKPACKAAAAAASAR